MLQFLSLLSTKELLSLIGEEYSFYYDQLEDKYPQIVEFYNDKDKLRPGYKISLTIGLVSGNSLSLTNTNVSYNEYGKDNEDSKDNKYNEQQKQQEYHVHHMRVDMLNDKYNKYDKYNTSVVSCTTYQYLIFGENGTSQNLPLPLLVNTYGKKMEFVTILRKDGTLWGFSPYKVCQNKSSQYNILERLFDTNKFSKFGDPHSSKMYV